MMTNADIKEQFFLIWGVGEVHPVVVEGPFASVAAALEHYGKDEDVRERVGEEWSVNDVFYADDEVAIGRHLYMEANGGQ